MDIQKKFLCPRLVDYLAIVGARPSPTSRQPVQVNYKTIFLISIYFKFLFVSLKYEIYNCFILFCRYRSCYEGTQLKTTKTFLYLEIWFIFVNPSIAIVLDRSVQHCEKLRHSHLPSPTKIVVRITSLVKYIIL